MSRSPELGLVRPHLDGLQAGRFLIQRCDVCRAYQWLPRVRCRACTSVVEWAEVEAVGRLLTWTVVRNRPSGASPYAVAVIELVEPGVRVTGLLKNVSLGELSRGRLFAADVTGYDAELGLAWVPLGM